MSILVLFVWESGRRERHPHSAISHKMQEIWWKTKKTYLIVWMATTRTDLVARTVLLHLNLIWLRFLMFQIRRGRRILATSLGLVNPLRLVALVLLWLPLLVLHLLKLHLLLLPGVHSLGMVSVIWMEVVPCGYLLWYGHSRRWKDLLLFGSLLLLLFEQFLFFHAFATGENFAETPAHILEFEMSTCHRACILLIAFLLGIDTFVVGKIDIVNIIMVFSLGCHFSISIVALCIWCNYLICSIFWTACDSRERLVCLDARLSVWFDSEGLLWFLSAAFDDCYALNKL